MTDAPPTDPGLGASVGHAPSGLLWAATAGLLGVLVIKLAATCLYLSALLDQGLPTQIGLVLVKPAIMVVAGALVLLLAGWHARARSWPSGLLGLVGLAGLVGAFLYSPWMGIDPARLLAVGVGLGSGLLLWPVATGLWGRLRFGVALFWGLLLVVQVGVFTVPEAEDKATANELGLVSFEPGSEATFDYAGHSNKDNYPVCHFRYNDLGYRDEVFDAGTAAAERVLLVGDSFIWGDGIPTNEETLGYQLRERLAARAPGRFAVASAAFPGMNLYGYVRTAMAMQPVVRATVVVIGFLGAADLGLMDAQALIDAQPRSGWQRRLLINLAVRQDVHEASAMLHGAIAHSPEARSFSEAQLALLADHARRNGYRVALLRYDPANTPVPDGYEAIDLPEALRYPDHSSELWYARDNHPKPLLNGKLADLVADFLLAGAGG